MADLKKAIKTVEYGIRAAEIAGGGEKLGRSSIVMMYTTDLDNILELLKAQEPVKPYIDYDGQDVLRCTNCGADIFHPEHTQADEDERNYNKFCRHCGRAVKWDG